MESWTVFILGWLPLYSWIRLILLSYLVLPQTQGAKILYFNYVEPFIAQHEGDIEIFIGKAHERASAVGLAYLNQLIELIRERLLGMPPRKQETQPPAAAGAGAYAQNLLSRFAIPAARAGVVAPASDFYGMLSGAVAAATASGSAGTKSREAQVDQLSRGTLIPEHVNSNAEKMNFITSQRDKLGVLMQALDKEQQNLDLAYGPLPGGERSLDADLKKNRSDQSFDTIEHAEVGRADQQKAPGAGVGAGAGARKTTGGWMPSGWFGGGSDGQRSVTENATKELKNIVQGVSSSIDPGRR